MSKYLVRYLDNNSGDIIDSDICPIESYSHFNSIVNFINKNPNTSYKEIKSEKIPSKSNYFNGIIEKFLIFQFNSKRIENNPLFQCDSIKEVFLEDVLNNEKENAADSIESFCIFYPLIVISLSLLAYFLSDNSNPFYFLFDCFLFWTLATQYYSFKTIAIANLIVLVNIASFLISLLRLFGVFHDNGFGSLVGSLIWLWASIKTNKKARLFNSFVQNKNLFSGSESTAKLFGSIALFSFIAGAILLFQSFKNNKVFEFRQNNKTPEIKFDTPPNTFKKDLENGRLSLISVGETDIYIPTPEGFLESSKRFPAAFDLRNKAKALKLVLLYFTEDEFREREVDLNSETRIVCDVKILKSIETTRFDKILFKEVVKEISEYAKLETSKISNDVNNESGNENIKIDVKSVKVINETSDRVVTAFEIFINERYVYVISTSILVKDKVINLYITGRNNEPEELKELLDIESRWTRKIFEYN